MFTLKVTGTVRAEHEMSKVKSLVTDVSAATYTVVVPID
jgi:hypothetical protein